MNLGRPRGAPVTDQPNFPAAALRAVGLKKIPINIWDDYFEDGFVPRGKIQKTRAYVESSVLSMEFKNDVLRLFFETLKKVNRAEGVAFFLRKRGKEELVIEINGLTHTDRKVLVKRLQKTKPAYRGVPLDVYSES